MTPRELARQFTRWTREEQSAFIQEAGLLTLLKAASGETGLRKDPRKQESGRREMIARRSTRCVVCGEAIQIGADIYWQRDHGAWHVACDRGRIE
jgi:hypothetical protein